MAFGKNQAMKQAIRLRIGRANDRSETVRLVSNRPVNPNRMGGHGPNSPAPAYVNWDVVKNAKPRHPNRMVARPGRYKPSLRPLRPRPLLPGLKRPKRPGRKVVFGPGSGRYGPGPR